MIPIKLSIQGLYSYQDIQEIDFRRLIGASVFGIFGKVGSGKTSLLEAISFALYGKTERLNDQDKRAYNMMNLKSKQLRIDFEFQAGPDQRFYKFVYEAKRHPKKHHEINPGERRMFVRQANDWHPIGNEKEDISVLTKQILGLDYDNFKRTIIIPQNQFREFLELSPTDRTKMMNQLFKLDQYDLAERARKLSDRNNTDLAKLQGLLAPLASVAPDAIEQAKVHIDSIQQNIVELVERIGQLEPTEQQLLHLRQQYNSLIWAREELEQWVGHEPKFQKIQQDVDQYEQCRFLFQADLAALDKLQNRRGELANLTHQAQQRLDNLTNRLPALITTYTVAKTAYENRETIQQRINELDTVQQIRTLQHSVEQLTRNQTTLDRQNKQQKTQIDQHKAERKTHQAFIDDLLGQESNLERLYKVQNWFGIHKPLKKQADTLQQQLNEYATKVDHLKQRKDDSLKGFSAEWAGKDFTLKTLPAEIDRNIERLKTIQQQCEVTHQNRLLQYELQRYAESLTDGSPCPLCGSTHHPTKHSDSITDSDVAKSSDSLRQVRQQIDDHTALRLTINGLETELRSVLDTTKRLINERTDIVQQLTAHGDQFIWPEFTIEQEQAVSEAIQQEGYSQKRLQDAQKAIIDLNKWLDEAEILLAESNESLLSVTNGVIGSTAQIQVHIDSLEHYKLPDVDKWTLSKIDELRKSLTYQYDQVKTDFDDADKRRNEAEKGQATLQEQVQQLTGQVAELSHDITTQEEVIDKSLADSSLTRPQVVQILRTNLDVDQEKRRVKEYEQQLRDFRKLVSDLEAELTRQPFNPDTLATIQKELQTLRGQRDARNKELGKATNVLTTLEQQWAQKQIHEKKQDELTLRQQDLKKMDDLFRAQGFVNYVSSVYLKNLCESANDRFFKLTNNQLKLELDEKNNFQVRDYLNGGEIRSVKTLSGGQMFQASLSLALALSDNIQHLTKAKQNLFFLDEGFGTLDKDSLQTVFKTLKALRSENRVVGIISHVEELQHEVDTYVRAEASENGSRIIRSWDE